MSSWLTVATAVGVAAMLAPGLFVWSQFVTVPHGRDRGRDRRPAMAAGAIRLPGKDGRLGTSDVRLISSDNPLGLNPNDPAGQDDIVIEADDLHLPIGRPVKVLLRSIDVLHDFYVPEFRAKMDMIPGSVTYFWFTPTRTGSFEVLCAELCGIGHPMMRGTRRGRRPKRTIRPGCEQQQTFAQLAATDRA